MSTSKTASDVPVLTSVEKRRNYNKNWTFAKYHNNDEFRQKEIQRCSERIKNRYHTDPEYRQKIIDRANARNKRLREAKQMASQ